MKAHIADVEEETLESVFTFDVKKAVRQIKVNRCICELHVFPERREAQQCRH
jgi:hypothetical protein